LGPLRIIGGAIGAAGVGSIVTRTRRRPPVPRVRVPPVRVRRRRTHHV